MGSHNQTAGVLDGRGVFLLSLVAVCAVAAIDLAVGTHTVLVELLLLGPVVAAFGASPGHTAIVALFAVAVAIPLGLTADDFNSTNQLTSLAAVGLVGGLAVGIARLRSDRERDAARLSVQYGVARVLAEADSLTAAGPRPAPRDRRPARMGLRRAVGRARRRRACARPRPGLAPASRRPSSMRPRASS